MVSRYYPGKYGNTFKAGHPKHFELWGSNNPNPDGSFDDSWVLLSEYESVKPSGGGVNDALTTEDQEAAKMVRILLFPIMLLLYVTFVLKRMIHGEKHVICIFTNLHFRCEA